MKKLLYILLVSVLLLTSCNTIMLDDRSGDVPSWYLRTPTRRDMVGFSSMGTGATTSQARSASLTALLDEVSAYLGRDVTSRYFRQLEAFSAVEELGLTIQREVQVSDSYYILAYAPEETLQEHRPDEFKAILEREDEIASLIAEAETCYRDNEDVKGLRLLLEAMRISASGAIFTEDYEASVIMERAMRWISQLEIRIVLARPDSGEARVRVVRNRGLFSPSVGDANIIASVPVYLSNGTVSLFTIPLKTDDKGYVEFFRLYPMQSRSGTVSFSLDLEKEVSEAEELLGEEFFSGFRAALDAVTASVSYEISINDPEIICVFNEFDSYGDELPSAYARDAFISFFAEEGITLTPFISTEDDLEAMYELIRRTYPEADYLIWGRAGVTDEIATSDGRTIYNCGGYTLLADLDSESILATDELTRSSEWRGDGQEDTLQRLFTTYANACAAYFIQFF